MEKVTGVSDTLSCLLGYIHKNPASDKLKRMMRFICSLQDLVLADKHYVLTDIIQTYYSK